MRYLVKLSLCLCLIFSTTFSQSVYAEEPEYAVDGVFIFGGGFSSVKREPFSLRQSKFTTYGSLQKAIPQEGYSKNSLCDGWPGCKQWPVIIPGFPSNDKNNLSQVGSTSGQENIATIKIKSQTNISGWNLWTLNKDKIQKQFKGVNAQFASFKTNLEKSKIQKDRAIAILDGYGGTDFLYQLFQDHKKEVSEIGKLNKTQKDKLKKKFSTIAGNIADNYISHINSIKAAGVKRILVRELPAFENAPCYLALKDANKDDKVFTKFIDDLPKLTNSLIAQKINDLDKAGLVIYIDKRYARMKKVLNDPTKFGFYKNGKLNIHKAFKDKFGRDYIHAKDKKQIADVLKRFLFIDDIMITEQAHYADALLMLQAMATDPEFYALFYNENEKARLALKKDLDAKVDKFVQDSVAKMAALNKSNNEFHKYLMKTKFWFADAEGRHIRQPLAFAQIGDASIKENVMAYSFAPNYVIGFSFLDNEASLASPFTTKNTLISAYDDEHYHFGMSLSFANENAEKDSDLSHMAANMLFMRKFSLDDGWQFNPFAEMTYHQHQTLGASEEEGSITFDMQESEQQQTYAALGFDVNWQKEQDWGQLNFAAQVKYARLINEEIENGFVTLTDHDQDLSVSHQLSSAKNKMHFEASLEAVSHEKISLSLAYEYDSFDFENQTHSALTEFQMQF